ncbi:uncharacterized protein LOC130642138 [Hydractinia symbiolongicarpus]|uniref:uncharacterized protein LOC130642138 n=1 Tax=Hydractinia symbiolongicarpus TaxID=13093 RepID=UPI00254DD70D|nr:uncharacterized protein LOC130642138 [Hydractinia symbiolongicarpus]
MSLVCLFLITLLVPGTMAGSYETALQKQKCQLLGYKLTVRIPGCKETVVHINTCFGACISLAAAFKANFRFGHIQNCCKVKQYVTVKVRLECPVVNNKLQNYYHPVRHASVCSCTRC